MPSQPRKTLSALEIRAQILGLLRRFEELGLEVPNAEAVSGLVEAAAIRAYLGGLSETKFKRMAGLAHANARLADQIGRANAGKIVVADSHTVQ